MVQFAFAKICGIFRSKNSLPTWNHHASKSSFVIFADSHALGSVVRTKKRHTKQQVPWSSRLRRRTKCRSLQPVRMSFLKHQEQIEGDSTLRELWIEQIHSSSPETDWKQIDRANALLLSMARPPGSPVSFTESFARNQISGTWHERGSKNQAGNLKSARYVSETDQIYGIGGVLAADVGGKSVWRGNRDGTGWTVLNDDYILQPRVLEALIPSGGNNVRLVSAEGLYVVYSDDEGQSWQSSAMNPGFQYEEFGTAWRLEYVNGDPNTLYYIVRTWDPGPWAYRMWMYRSTDGGQSFDRILVFTETSRNRIDIWVPESGETIYVLEGGSTLYVVDSNSSNVVTTSGLPTNGDVILTGSLAPGSATLYALIDDSLVYRSLDGGWNWSFQGTAPISAWDVGMICSPTDEAKLFIGGVNCYFSYDSGASWELANNWSEYYGNIDLLHADIMDLEFCYTDQGMEFLLISNHGGLHVTYDNLQTTQNLARNNLNLSQYYDVLTHPEFTDYLYAGSQDQGWQWTASANGNLPLDLIQEISGDYGQQQFLETTRVFGRSILAPFFGIIISHSTLPTTEVRPATMSTAPISRIGSCRPATLKPIRARTPSWSPAGILMADRDRI